MKMRTLYGSSLQEDIAELLPGKATVHPLKLAYGPHSETFYALKLEEKESWLSAMRQVLPRPRISDFYEMQVTTSPTA